MLSEIIKELQIELNNLPIPSSKDLKNNIKNNKKK